MMKQTILLILVAIPYLNTEYIPPGPRFQCPKDKTSQLLYPCVCEKGADAGLYIKCDNSGLATLSVGLGNLASLDMQVEQLTLNECHIAHLFGPLLQRLKLRVLHILHTPLRTIDPYALAGVNRTLQEIYMVGTDIMEFPKDAFKILGNLTVLSIDGHKLTKLKKDMFAGSEAVGKLERVHLVNGLVDEVDPEAFQSLKKLKKLDLHGNRLAALKRNQFKGLRDTEVLDLSHNNITKLDGSHIGDLTKLGWCNVSYNQISDIPRGMFSRNTILKVVHLNGNKITKLDVNSFRGMRFLRRLFLQDNEIKEVGRGTFNSLTRIGTLDLARNKIPIIDFQMFHQLKYAELIDVSGNEIKVIEKQSFTDLYLAVVNVSHNRLTDIEVGAFQNCNNMTLLDLSHNMLKGIRKNAFDEFTYASEFLLSYNLFEDFGEVPIQNMTGIKVLNASHNIITRIPRNAFPKLYELHTVDISYNNLSEVFNAVFQPLFSLRYLDLSYNALTSIKLVTFGTLPTMLQLDVSRGSLAKLASYMYTLTSIKPATFGTLLTVLQLDLSHNRLTDVSRGSLAKLASCRTIYVDLSHNALKLIKPGTFGTLPTVLQLDLSHNRLTDVSRGSLAKLASCRTMYLGHNRLEKLFEIPAALQELNVEFNNLTKIKVNTWPSMNSLLRLNLSSNNLEDRLSRDSFAGLLTLQSLDLSNNSITRPPWEALNTMSSLQYLYMQHNNLTVVPKSAFGNLPTIFHLDLSYNQINLVEKLAFNGLQQLLDLSFKGNVLENIGNEAFKGLVALRRLDLSHNFIEKIDNKTNGLLDDCLSLEMVNLSHNKFSFLTKKMFPASPWIPYRLQIVDLSYNSLSLLSFSATYGAKKLQKLYLNGNYINEISNYVLGNFTSLQVLDLSNNQLVDLKPISSEHNLTFPANLTELYLQNNLLNVLPVGNIIEAKSLRLVDVRHNQLQRLDANIVRKIKDYGLRVLFEGNPLKCDCFIRPLKHYLNHLPNSQIKSDKDYNNITCAEPSNVEGANIASLDEDRLLCAGNTVLDEEIAKYGNTEESLFEDEPDLSFRDVQSSQEQIYAIWFVRSTRDVADFYLYIRNDKNDIIYNNLISYNLRTLTITIDNDMRSSLKSGGNFEICIQAKTSNDMARKWYKRQCQNLPPNFGSWPKKIDFQRRRSNKKRVTYKSNVLGLVSDSILITLCIFLGAFFRRLSELDI